MVVTNKDLIVVKPVQLSFEEAAALRHMTGDHHGRTATQATLLVTAARMRFSARTAPRNTTTLMNSENSRPLTTTLTRPSAIATITRSRKKARI
jgi:hypothetical protein